MLLRPPAAGTSFYQVSYDLARTIRLGSSTQAIRAQEFNRKKNGF
jgi:hypothetical protein